MQKNKTKLMPLFIAFLLATSFIVGCSHMETNPNDKTIYWYIHKPLPEASQKLDEARAAGKDKKCPAEFRVAADTVDKAYDLYKACHTEEAISMAQSAINKINALCPPPPPPPPPPPAPKVKVFDAVTLFDFDKSELKPKGKELIKDYIEKTNGELRQIDMVKVTGHTDNIGSDDYNLKLSLRRAKAVRDFLITLGLDSGKIGISGEGEKNPIADNKTKEGRAKNRRVVVEVTGLEK